MMQSGFYVSIKRGDDFRPLLGPFDRHSDAIAAIPEGQAKAIAYASRHHFDEFGTVKITAEKLPKGIFNT